MFTVFYIFIVSSILKECSYLQFPNQDGEEIQNESANKDGKDDEDELSSEESGSENENKDDDDCQSQERLAELNTDEEKRLRDFSLLFRSSWSRTAVMSYSEK